MRQRLVTLAGWLAALAVLLGVAAVAEAQLGTVAAQSGNTASEEQEHSAQSEPLEPGLVVTAVHPDGAAAAAGVERGDILLKVDDREINGPYDLRSYLHEQEPGDSVTLTVLHGDEERTLTATLAEEQHLGLALCGASHASLAHPAEGALIVGSDEQGPAAQAGLQQDDRITAVDGQKVDAEHRLSDMIAAHRPGDSVALEVTSPKGETRTVNVTLGEHPEDAEKAYLGVKVLQPSHRVFVHRMEAIAGDGPAPDEMGLRHTPPMSGTLRWHSTEEGEHSFRQQRPGEPLVEPGESFVPPSAKPLDLESKLF